MNAHDTHYTEQGYKLPDGLTWDIVEASRKQWDIADHHVPLTCAGGAVAWGVPFHEGKPMARLG